MEESENLQKKLHGYLTKEKPTPQNSLSLIRFRKPPN